MVNNAQHNFNQQYITVSELSELYGVSVYMLSYLRKTGKLPGAIKVGSCFIYERNGTIHSILEEYSKNKRNI